MAAADVQTPSAEPAPALPDYVLNPNAVLQDQEAAWRYGLAPDYSKTRKFFSETKKHNHTAGSLPDLVENLVKNWEIEASFKTQLEDWRTVDKAQYTFSINGGPAQSANHMLNVGTYNAIIAPNEFYSPKHSDFASSHKTFKRMMPTFAWEVVEVYSGPPVASFKWRHWGVMKNDYVGFNDKGEKITAKAHGGQIDVEGVTVAHVNDKLQVVKLETWFDPLEMFRQITPKGIVNKEIVDKKVDLNGIIPTNQEELSNHTDEEKAALGAVSSSTVNGEEAERMNPDKISDPTIGMVPSTGPDHIDTHLAKPSDEVHPHPKDVELAVQPVAGETVAAPADSAETKATHEEMSKATSTECPFLMNRE
ncbi:MAG: hypothetical protein M1822_001652 [Bathelium mastoideum]|nr:MAG: hypothetical protein M1822_001652 [Bathelium mastoideum]